MCVLQQKPAWVITLLTYQITIQIKQITYELVWLPKLITSTKSEDKIYGKNKHLINIFF